jgi:hypothetical protein
MMRITTLVVLVAPVLLACAPPSTAGPAHDPNVITREEITASSAANAYEAVSRLRPNFLQSHGQTTITGSDTGYPRVYLDHMPYGDISTLRSLDANGIFEIRYYNSAAASNRFGLGNVSGAIEVISRPRP